MNSFGRIFRVSITGESHGAGIAIIVDGCPTGIPLTPGLMSQALERRKPGAKGTTTRTEDDLPLIESGVFNELTTGSPILIRFTNKNTRSTDYEALRATPRPGHADFTASHKFFGFEDYRGGGHFSGRLTVGLVAAGSIAGLVLDHLCGPDFKISATVVEAGGETDIEVGLQRALDSQDSIGGIVECTITGVPVGWGEPFFDSVESVLSHAAFSIPAIKGIEFGSGFSAARMFGSRHNDSLLDADGKTATNHAGGINGGLTNGNPIIFRVAVKPTSSTPAPQVTFNKVSGQQEELSIKGRHDLCIALRVPVVLESIAAIALADLALLRLTQSASYKPRNGASD